MNPIWVLVNCNSPEEAEKIGDQVLEARLASCFDIFTRDLAKYFWPPKTGKTETTKGALLVIETFESKYPDLFTLINKLHSDDLPFIGFFRIEGTSDAYREWLKGELSAK